MSDSDHVKVVGPVNYATVFPACRAVVHPAAPAPRPRAYVPEFPR